MAEEALLPVHPRLCGEHGYAQSKHHSRSGSSPPVRGTLDGPRFPQLGHRFIPACAGNTAQRLPAIISVTVHPRLCGEHEVASRIDVQFDGSSPPVRGTRKFRQSCRMAQRFIPACAGNTIRSAIGVPIAPVHPRLCGEHAMTSFPACIHSGSSPPVRGTHVGASRWEATVRFIPACAGNTKNHLSESASSPVHPRLCGEHVAYSDW